jgi:hypothetical protein
MSPSALISLVAVVVAVAVVPAMAIAADTTAVEEVVVTGARMTEYDPVQTPHIALVHRADNLMTSVKVICDTRDQSQRRAELKATLRNMIKAAASDPNIALGVGEEVVGSFDDTMLDAAIKPDAKADTSYAELLVKTSIGATDTFDAATGRIKRYIDRTPKDGRTEILRQGDWQLTLIGPTKYRPQVIGLVADDAHKVADAFGPGYGVSVEGLQRPVSWYQSGPLDLALYIPYKLEVHPLAPAR